MKKFIDRVGLVSILLYAIVVAMVFWFVFVGIPGYTFWESAAMGAMILGLTAVAIGDSFFLEDK